VSCRSPLTSPFYRPRQKQPFGSSRSRRSQSFSVWFHWPIREPQRLPWISALGANEFQSGSFQRRRMQFSEAQRRFAGSIQNQPSVFIFQSCLGIFERSGRQDAASPREQTVLRDGNRCSLPGPRASLLSTEVILVLAGSAAESMYVFETAGTAQQILSCASPGHFLCFRCMLIRTDRLDLAVLLVESACFRISELLAIQSPVRP